MSLSQAQWGVSVREASPQPPHLTVAQVAPKTAWKMWTLDVNEVFVHSPDVRLDIVLA